MKIFKGIGLLFGLLFLILSCQKDDICAETTPTTPMLIVRFYDFDNPSELKPVVGLNIIAKSSSDSLYVGERTTDSIAIPLKTFQNTTTYSFIKFLGEETTGGRVPPNADVLKFSYVPTEEFISKACGFKTEYLDFQALSVKESGTGNWIKDVVIEQTVINNETRAHLTIYH